MSTIGGSRGERNAKPKFSALDINSLYRSSRGETLEPLAQKNAVPRKHGMQILGKVPSARRPPANLPSLRAETSTPKPDQSGSWPATSSSSTSSSTTSNQTTATAQSLDKQSIDQKSYQNNTASNNNISHNNSNNSNSSNNSNNKNNSNNSNNNKHNNNKDNHNSASWSAVTGSNDIGIPKPLLYQSPQFQHEFPSLDGSKAQAPSKGSRGGSHDSHSNTSHQNANINAFDAQNIDSNRTQYENQIEQNSVQNQGGNMNSLAAPVHQQVVPPQLRALMPQFMSRNLPPEPEHPQIQQQFGNRDINNRIIGRSGESRGDQYQSYNRRDRNDERSYQRRGPPHRSNRHEQNQYDDYESTYQSIIKEEELERIDQIVKDDAWAQDDDFDYNQKLVFSDDDSDTPPPTSSNKHNKDSKRVNFRDSDRDKDSKSVSQRKDEERLAYNRERDQRDMEHNDRNDREKNELPPRMQQNGHRPGAPIVDTDLLERVKQRKEEEEKRVNERRLAAAKKLQELEQKINKKKEMNSENENETSSVSSGQNYGKSENEPRINNDRYSRDDNRSMRDNKDESRYGNRYESKYDRDMGSRDRGAPNATDAGAYYNKPYQPNLPPRFQKQREQQDVRHGFNKLDAPHRPSPRDHNLRRPTQQGHPIKRNDEIGHSKERNLYYSNPKSNDDQYSGLGKAVIDSEDDERASSGRDSISRSSVGGDRPLKRSTSDSSQPEFKDRIGSWADEMESDAKVPQRKISNTSSTTANEEIQPKQILQRVRKISIESRSDKEKSEEPEVLSASNISAKSHNSQEDVNKLFGTSPISLEAPKSWVDSSPSTPEIARKSAENFTDASNASTNKTIDSDKKPLESVLENELSDANAEKKVDEKSNLAPIKVTTGRGYTKETYSSDDGKHGAMQKRPNARGGRHDTRGPPQRNYGGSYRGHANNNWNNRRGKPGRYNDYSESEGSDDDYHGRGNRGKDEVFVPRGEPSRRGRGGKMNPAPMVNYGPPSSKRPFATNDEKSDEKAEASVIEAASSVPTKKIETKPADETAPKAVESSGKEILLNDKVQEEVNNGVQSADSKLPKVEEKKAPLKSAFTSPPAAVPNRKDSTGQKVESQTAATKPEEKTASVPSPASQPQRNQQAVVTEKPHSGTYGGASQSKQFDKNIAPKKEESGYAHGPRGGPNAPNMSRGKPQPNIQSSNKPMQQNVPAKISPGNLGKPANIPNLSQPQNNVSNPIGSNALNRQQHQPHQPHQQHQQHQPHQQHQSHQQHQQHQSHQPHQQHQQPPNKFPSRFVNKQRDRTGSGSSNTWDKSDISFGSDTHDSDFVQRSSNQSIEKLNQDGSKNEQTGKMSTIIFENTSFKSMPGPIKRQTAPNQQPGQQQGPRGGPNQYDPSQSGQMGGHHPHHPQNQHHLDKKADDVFKNASSGGNFQDMLDSQQQQLQSQVQRPHQSQADSITSALQTMSFPKSDAEYEKDLKLAFTFESEMLSDDKNTKGSLCIPPSRSTAIHSVATGQNTISPSIADLSKKITSVKKVWETVPSMPTVIEHSNNSNAGGNNDDSHLSSTFVSTQNQQHMHQFTHSQQQQLHQSALGSYSNSFGPDPSALDHFAKVGQDGDMDNVGYNPNPQHIVGGPANNNNNHPNAGMKHNDPLSSNVNVCKVKPNQPPMHQSGGLGLSPPPMQQGIQAAPQPYYQPSQFGAIPSPPAVLYNSSPMPSQGNLYGHYERYITSAHYGAAGNAAPYNTPYMQSGPNLQAAPAPDMYQNMTSQYRMGGAPYNQQQQINNQSTVLISSSSNSLMSASVKPSSQQIGAIGTKVNAGQTPYGQQYMGMYAPQQQPPPQNNSYYSNSGGQGAFFGAPGANYGLQATGIFGPQAQPPSNQVNQPVANYNFLAINRQYQGQQNAGYSQQQQSSRNSQQQNPNQSQSQQSGQQSQQGNNNSQNQSGPPQSHAGQQDSVSNSFFK